MGVRGARSVTGAVAALLAAGLLSAGACSHAWDALEPLSSAGSTGSAATGTGTGGGSGAAGTGGGTTQCGGTNLLSWDFSAPQPDVFYTDDGATLVGGEGVITLPPTTSDSATVEWDTYRLYDLRGDHVSIEVNQVPAQTQGTIAGLDLRYDNGDDVFFGVTQGQLECGFDHDDQQSLPMASPYDPTTQRYWQIRESAGTIYCETSQDGTTWVPAGSFDVVESELAAPSGLRVAITATTPADVEAPGVFDVDDLNGGLPPAGVWCPALSYTDDFPAAGPVPGPAWDRSYTNDSTDSYDQMGGTLNLHFGADSSSGVGYGSSVAYDMTGERVSVQVLALPTLADGTVFLFTSNDDNTYVFWHMSADGFSCGYVANGDYPTIWQGQAPALPAWVGLRESGGSVYCEIYQSGSWQSYGSVEGAIDTTRADVYLGAAEISPGSYLGVLGNYNLAPQ
jgi:hypothetical protein